MDPFSLLLLGLVVPAAFVLSAAAGLGGSLILVPALAMALGVKKGIALAALLLGVNNLAKLWAYRRTLPWAAALFVALFVILGAALGAGLMVRAPEAWVRPAVILALFSALAGEWVTPGPMKRTWALVLAFFSGACSGFSGTSGPLKGVALRSLALNRSYFVGAASLVSLMGDMTKAALYTHSGLLARQELFIAGALIPVMFISTLGGRRLNQRVGERGYAFLFWSVMAGYTLRLMVAS